MVNDTRNLERISKKRNRSLEGIGERKIHEEEELKQ